MLEAQMLQDRFRGALLGGAVGDAIGAQAQAGKPPPSHEDSELTYTDATALTLAVAESLVQRGGFSGSHLATTFVTHYLNAPERGYSLPLMEVLQALSEDVAWNKAGYRLFRGSGSFSCEPALRVAPVALFAFRQPTELRRMARDVAIVTHHNGLAVEGAVLQATALALLLAHVGEAALNRCHVIDALASVARQEPFLTRLKHMPYLLRQGSLTEARELIGTGEAAPEAFGAALYALLRHPTNFTDTLHVALTFGNAQRSTAALAGALCGAYVGAKRLPAHWRERVEGREQLIELADLLLVLAIGGAHSGAIHEDAESIIISIN